MSFFVALRYPFIMHSISTGNSKEILLSDVAYYNISKKQFASYFFHNEFLWVAWVLAFGAPKAHPRQDP